MRMLDLERTFAGAGAATENLQYQAGTIQNFRIPGFFQTALLNRRKCAIHNHDVGFEAFDQTGDLFNFALTEIGRRPQRIEHDDAGLLDGKVDRAGKADRFVELCRRRALPAVESWPAQNWLDHEGAAGFDSPTTFIRFASGGLTRRQ